MNCKHEIVADEWNIRYRRHAEGLEEEAAATAATTSSSQPSMEEDRKLRRQVGTTMMLRAGTLGSLQNCLLQAASDKENTPAPQQQQALLDHTRNQLDEDLISEKAPFQRLMEYHLEYAQDRYHVIQKSHSENNPSTITTCKTSNLMPPQLKNLSLEADAFFAEYPECIRHDWNQLDSDDDESSSCSSDSDWKRNTTSKSRRRTKKEAQARPPQTKYGQDSSVSQPAAHRPPQEVAVYPSIQGQPHDSQLPGPPTSQVTSPPFGDEIMMSQSQPPQQSQRVNPYASSKLQTKQALTHSDRLSVAPSEAPTRRGSQVSTVASTNADFSYTPAPSQSLPAQQPHHQYQQPSTSSWKRTGNEVPSEATNAHAPPPPPLQTATNPYRHHHHHHPPGGPTRNPYAASSADPSSAATWRDHSNQQANPFQTAREAARTIRDQDTSNHHPDHHAPPPPRDHGRNGNGRAMTSNNRSTPYQNYAQDYHYNSTSNQDSWGDPQLPSNEPSAARGGPSIPDSLRRKFQPPKRIEPNTHDGKRPSGFAPNSRGGGGVQPTKPSKGQTTTTQTTKKNNSNQHHNQDNQNKKEKIEDDEELPEELQHLDKELVQKIQNEIMESGDTITFDDIAGLEDAKQTVQEVVCWPMKRPDLFTGLRRAPNGLLLYGPPGTGKTLIGKAIAHESGATFFSISSSSLTSKWIGEGEKLVKTLFAVAAYREPAVVFIDEIDSLLTQRKSTENEASRRIKTEFLVQLDGTGTSGQGRVLVIGATNKPQELDEAARRRFTKRLYIPLPAQADRKILLEVLLKKNNHRLTETDIDRLSRDTAGFSGADLKALCTDAAMGPIRQLGPKALEVDLNEVPPITFKHFKRSLKGTKPSVAPSDLIQYEEWDQIYGSKRAEDEDDEDDSSQEGAGAD